MNKKLEQFKDQEYRATYAESFLDTSVATQIRVLREQRGWTQAQLAEAAGMKQSRISALEDVNYSKWSIGTLKRLARAFDVPLNVAFGTFGRLVADVDHFNRAALERPSFADDPALSNTTGTMITLPQGTFQLLSAFNVGVVGVGDVGSVLESIGAVRVSIVQPEPLILKPMQSQRALAA